MPKRFKLLVVAAMSCAALSTAAYAQLDDSALFRKLAVKAQQGSAKAQYNLGMFYNNGIGTAQDPRLAFDWFVKAAAGGDPLASYKVGCYYAGQFPGAVPVDEDKALAAKLVAAKAGYYRAQHDVASIYASRSNFTEAVHWWQQAAAQGDIGSLGNLSIAYQKGLGTSKDAVNALQYMLIVARMVPPAQTAEANATLASLKKDMTPERIAQAEHAAAKWQSRPTELTRRDDLGIEEARQLVR